MAILNSSTFDFSDYVGQMLQEYGYEAVEAMTESINEVAKESVKKLKSESPRGSGGKREHGKYAKGWTVKYERGRLTTSATIHGKSGTYQLAHLLEFGHAKRTGGRSRSIVHIAPVEQWAINEVHERTVRKLSGGL